MSVAHMASLDGLAPEHLHGFFEGWPSPPTPERQLEILRGSYRVVLARRILDDLGSLYSVDVVCDHELGPFYEHFGMQPLLGMALRRPDAARG